MSTLAASCCLLPANSSDDFRWRCKMTCKVYFRNGKKSVAVSPRCMFWYTQSGHPFADLLFSTCLFPCTLCQLYYHVKKKPLTQQVKTCILLGCFSVSRRFLIIVSCIFVTQKMNEKATVWSSTLCSCYDDAPLCLLVCFGCCCAYGILKKKMGQDAITNCCCGLFCGFPCIHG